MCRTLGKKLLKFDQHVVAFFCPGCRTIHCLSLGAATSPRWDWDGNVDAPTFMPSVLVGKPTVCHSFIRGGQIHYLNDCTHAYAGQAVDLPVFTPEMIEFWDEPD